MPRSNPISGTCGHKVGHKQCSVAWKNSCLERLKVSATDWYLFMSAFVFPDSKTQRCKKQKHIRRQQEHLLNKSGSTPITFPPPPPPHGATHTCRSAHYRGAPQFRRAAELVERMCVEIFEGEARGNGGHIPTFGC